MRPILLTFSILAVVVGLAFFGLTSTRYEEQRASEVSAAARAVRGSEKISRTVTVNSETRSSVKAGDRTQGKESRHPVIKIESEPAISVEDAELDALVQAQFELERYLRGLNPPVYWKPPLDYIRNSLLKGQLATVDVKIKREENRNILARLGPEANVDSLTLKQVVDTIEITSPVRRDLLYHARLDTSSQRVFSLAPILAGLVLFLIAAATYIHLDERTKGYYTGWLRLAAGGAVAALIGIGWWWLSHRGTE